MIRLRYVFLGVFCAIVGLIAWHVIWIEYFGAYYSGVYFSKEEVDAKVKSGDEHELQVEKELELEQKQQSTPPPAH